MEDIRFFIFLIKILKSKRLLNQNNKIYRESVWGLHWQFNGERQIEINKK